MSKRELVCIGCPVGCQLEAEIENGEVVRVTGNTCKRGEEYAKKECSNPTRILTSSVKVIDGNFDVVSVKTEQDIPKDKIFECIEALKGVVIKAPINIGDVVVQNILGTGINVVATKKVEFR